MKYQNNSAKGVVIPVKRNVANEVASTSWIKFHAGEVKDIPEEAIATAEANGLTKVEESKEPKEETKEKESPVEAEVSEIGKTQVETKQVKKKRK